MDFVALMTAMQHNTWFRTLSCDGHTIGTEGMLQIADIVARNQTITTLSLKNTNAKAAGMKECLLVGRILCLFLCFRQFLLLFLRVVTW
jgi:hypothetical protein